MHSSSTIKSTTTVSGAPAPSPLPSSKKCSKKKLRISRQKTEDKLRMKQRTEEEGGTEMNISNLKSSIACPTHMLAVLLKQTSLNEPAIHVRYMKFRKDYPSGFIGPAALTELCAGVLPDEDDRNAFVALVFKLYGRQGKGGWNTMLIGFRELLLATESMHCLKRPDKFLGWLFKVYNTDGSGLLPVEDIRLIVDVLLTICVPSASKDEHNTLAVDMLLHFSLLPYDQLSITEEEFVYDALRNESLVSLLQQSLLADNFSGPFMTASSVAS